MEGKGGQPVMAREVCEALGMGVQPQQTEPMRGKLKAARSRKAEQLARSAVTTRRSRIANAARSRT